MACTSLGKLWMMPDKSLPGLHNGDQCACLTQCEHAVGSACAVWVVMWELASQRYRKFNRAQMGKAIGSTSWKPGCRGCLVAS